MGRLPPDKDSNARRSLRLKTAAALNRLRRYTKELPKALRQADSHDHPPLPLDLPHVVAERPLAASWLGHATVLLRLGGRWILTDPVFSARIGIPIGPVTLGLGRHAPAIDPATLPRPDLILISHAHFDHLDVPSLKRLIHPETRVVTASGTGRLIPRGFAEVDELGWDRELRVDGLTLRAMQPRHWGARVTIDRRRGYNSYLLDSDARRALFAGDTALTDRFKSLAEEPRRTDLAIFGIGAYDPWIHNHASPEQVWEMFNQSGARRLMPMHHSTFKLSDEPREEPLQRLLLAAGSTRELVVAHELGGLWVDEP